MHLKFWDFVWLSQIDEIGLLIFVSSVRADNYVVENFTVFYSALMTSVVSVLHSCQSL